MDAMVLAMPTLAELTGILDNPSKRPLAALFLANEPLQEQREDCLVVKVTLLVAADAFYVQVALSCLGI